MLDPNLPNVSEDQGEMSRNLKKVLPTGRQHSKFQKKYFSETFVRPILSLIPPLNACGRPKYAFVPLLYPFVLQKYTFVRFGVGFAL